LNKATLPLILFAALWAAEKAEVGFTERGLAGYRPWTNVRPWMTVGMRPEDNGLVGALELYCPGAVEMKISMGGGFAEIPWRPFESSLRWAFPPGASRVALRAVFREKRKGDAIARVTPPLVRLLDLKDPDRVLTGDDEGAWMDWTDGILHGGARAAKRVDERHDAGEARRLAEGEMKQVLGAAFMSLAAEEGIRMADLLGGVDRLGRVSLDLLQWIRLDEIDFHESGATRVKGSLPLWGPSARVLRETALLLRPEEPRPDAAKALDPEGLLVIDTRGLHFAPCMFPQVWSEDERPCLVPGRGAAWERPYVRYLRRPSQASLARLGGLTGLKRAPVFIKAIGSRPGAPSTLLVTRRHRDLILGVGPGFSRWLDGGWVLIVD
jgi:hypothetical protein